MRSAQKQLRSRWKFNSDFQSACKQLFKTTNQLLMDNYVTRKGLFDPSRFPLPMHAHSRVAATMQGGGVISANSNAVEQALVQNQEKWEAMATSRNRRSGAERGRK